MSDGDKDSGGGDHLGCSGVAERQGDAVSDTASKVTRDTRSNVTSDTASKGRKKKAPMSLVTRGSKASKGKVLHFQPRSNVSLPVNDKLTWKTAKCGCYLPVEPGFEWRDMENGHRLLLMVGFGLSKAGKKTKRRKYFRYFTHSGVRLYVESEYGVHAEHAAKA